jgi:hypothetical protein
MGELPLPQESLAEALAFERVGNTPLALRTIVETRKALKLLDVEALCLQVRLLRRGDADKAALQQKLDEAARAASYACDGPPIHLPAVLISREEGLVLLSQRDRQSHVRGLIRLQSAYRALDGVQDQAVRQREQALTTCAIGKAFIMLDEDDKGVALLRQALDSESLQEHPIEMVDALLWLLRVEPDRRVRRQLAERIGSLTEGARGADELSKKVRRLVQCHFCTRRVLDWKRHL